VNSPFAWPGGKRGLTKKILPLIPEHDAYCEPFCGSAKLLFAKDTCGFEVINDINGDLVNFFRVVKHRPSALAEALEREIVARDRFAELKQQTGLTCEIERAARFFFLQKQSFGAKGADFASQVPAYGRGSVKSSLDAVADSFESVARRLRRVLVENRDWRWCVERFDSPGTFFYCDPPYTSFGKIGAYAQPEEGWHAGLMATLATIQGKFLLSLDAAPEIRREAAKHGFEVRKVETTYTLAGGSNKKRVGELLIANYPLPTHVG
jgi:DNA adenine methylase